MLTSPYSRVRLAGKQRGVLLRQGGGALDGKRMLNKAEVDGRTSVGSLTAAKARASSAGIKVVKAPSPVLDQRRTLKNGEANPHYGKLIYPYAPPAIPRKVKIKRFRALPGSMRRELVVGALWPSKKVMTWPMAAELNLQPVRQSLEPLNEWREERKTQHEAHKAAVLADERSYRIVGTWPNGTPKVVAVTKGQANHITYGE